MLVEVTTLGMDDDNEEILDHWLHRDIFVPGGVEITTPMQNGGP